MASNAQTAQPSGLSHSFKHASSPANTISTTQANNATRTVSPSSASGSGETSSRKMKRTGAAKPLMRPSLYGGQAPPWATSLLGGKSFTAPAPSPPTPAQASAPLQAQALPQAQAESKIDTPELEFAQPSSSAEDSDDSGGTESGSPEPARIVSDIAQPDPEDPLAVKLEAVLSEGGSDSDMAREKKSLAQHAKIQALQDSWASSNASGGQSGSAGQSANAKDWLGGGGSASEASFKRKHALTENLAGGDAKRQATDIDIRGASTRYLSEEGTNPAATEQDLLNVLGLGQPGSRPDILKSTEDASSPAGATHQAQVIESSDEDMDYEDQADADHVTDEDEDEGGETEGDLEINTTGTPSTKAALPPSQGTDQEFTFTKNPHPRGYLQWRTPQGIESTCGAIIPTNYKFHSDPKNPYICPVRNCRVIFPKWNGLGAHFCAKHRSSKFNDNLDGTLSFVDYYKRVGTKYAAPIVVSQNPLRGDEPPLAEPVTAGYKPVSAPAGAPNPVPWGPTPKPLNPAPARATPKSYLKNDMTVIKQSLVAPPPSQSVPASDGSLLTYLSGHLSPAYKIPVERPDVKALLKLPRRRPLPQTWKLKYTGIGHLAPLATVALLIFLTGDIATPCCHVCYKHNDPFENFLQPCVVMSATAPGFLKEIGNKACSGCQWRSNFRRERNNCSFLSSGQGVPSPQVTPIAPPTRSAVATRSASATTAADAYALPYPPASQPPPKTSTPVSAASLPPSTQPAPSTHKVNSHPPLSPPRRTTRYSAANAKLPVDSAASTPAGHASSLSGNIMPPNTLEMEDWEVAPGRIRDERSESPTNVAFSNSYLTSNQAVTVSEEISFNVIVIKPGESHEWAAESEKVRICSLAAGKLKVKLENTEPFSMGPNGMFKMKPGTGCTVLNRLYIDAVVHVTTVSSF
ncbi:hypothetical protein CaCOL14_004754 [Colletotrichum acutatum]|uniref:C2H2-type domain-containing protein n=1 Tax=Glomerella acutata TaxID=27357 RepID=A0AAD8UF42_GLOAC|nr:uncharacterized protein BDZ83DRAFT_754859 [Colletotrichum acutatum]KAK1720347.1 hypothetical protein BDZ83DRAFT_754859 [Colletotrichum acutatum]